jgi:hypothetical protein
MPPCWTRTQLSGCLHYPTCGSEGEPEHLQPQRDNGHMSQTAGAAALDNMGWTTEAGQLNGQYLMSSVTPQALTRTVQDFLSQAAGAVVFENGAVAFLIWHNPNTPFPANTTGASFIFGRWSETLFGACLIAVQRLGQARPSKLEICRERDRRSPTARRVGPQNSPLKDRCFFSGPGIARASGHRYLVALIRA